MFWMLYSISWRSSYQMYSIKKVFLKIPKICYITAQRLALIFLSADIIWGNPRAHSESSQSTRMKRFAKIYFRKKLHLSCLTGFWIHLWNSLQKVMTVWSWVLRLISFAYLIIKLHNWYLKFLIGLGNLKALSCVNKVPMKSKNLGRKSNLLPSP